MILQAAYTFFIILFQIPAGTLADKLGRKRILVISTLSYVGAFLMTGSSDSLLRFFVAEIIWASSTATIMGTGEAFLYDSSHMAGLNYKRIQGNSYAITDTMIGLTGILSGFIGQVMGLRPLFFMSAIPASLALIVALTFKEHRHYRSVAKEEYLIHAKESFSYILRKRELVLVIAFSSIVSTIVFMTFFLFQIHFTQSGLELKYIGLAYAALFLFSASGNKSCDFLEKRLGEKYSILFILIGSAFLLFGVALAVGWVAVVFAGLLYFLSGFKYSLVPFLVNKHAADSKRATILSINYTVGNLLFTVFSPVFGYISDIKGLAVVFISQSAVLILAFFLFSFIMRPKIQQ